MAGPRRGPPRFLPENVRRKVDVASAMAWEALVEAHVEQAMQFIVLLDEYEPVEESLPRYLREMDLYETMATAIRTRVLTRVEDDPSSAHQNPDATTALRFPGEAETSDPLDGDTGWSLLRRPQRVVRGVLRRQRRNEEMERRTQLALARAEEHVIRTHIENAIGFVALLADQLPLDRAIQIYVGAVALAGGRAQSVFQRTMAKLAEVHLPQQA